jgi:heme-degrading monooxygenase HmoA
MQPKPQTVVSYLKLSPKPALVQEFLQYLDEMTKLVRQHPGFISVEVLQPKDEPGVWVLLSEWESEADFKAWEHSPRHEQVMDDYNKRIGPSYKNMRFNRYR